MTDTVRHPLAVVEQHATKLSSDHRAILVAAASKQTYDEIAAQLGLTLGTVKSRLHRAKKALDRLVRIADHKEQANA